MSIFGAVAKWWRGKHRKALPTSRPGRLQVETLEDRNLLTSGAGIALQWNEITLNAIRVDKTAPPKAARALAMVSTAVFDAVNSIEKDYAGYEVQLNAPRFTSDKCAAATAAFQVLRQLFPNQRATFHQALQGNLAKITDGPGENWGRVIGRSAARKILKLRADDGADATVNYVPSTNPGDWKPTPAGFAPALLPQWVGVDTWGIASGSQFRPGAPPALTSDAYTTAYNEVLELGKNSSATRSAEQTQIAQFWADGAGTETPPGHWNTIAKGLVRDRKLDLAQASRVFALLNIALADAAIVCWDAKYAHDFWRPVTAIRAADTDGNPNTTADAAWSPLLATPPFPSYTSGHSTFSGAAAQILTKLFGNAVAFSTKSDGLAGVTRNFSSFQQAAQEAGKSRIYGGIHYEFDNQEGLRTGQLIADAIYGKLLKPQGKP